MKFLHIVFLLIVLLLVCFVAIIVRKTEGFGYSMGTLIQLQTSHVPNSPEEIEEEQAAYLAQVQHDLLDMTGGTL